MAADVECGKFLRHHRTRGRVADRLRAVTADDRSADRIVELADHVARAGASVDDSATLRELIAEHPDAAAAAYARAARLASEAFTDHGRERWTALA
jgi:hypothetical protein